ncbi:MAG TPA: glycosyltransferase, partial [Chloroflexi bacterium]|nr:glycosyltransferase [Chloroflexota bacterium]
MRIAILAAGSEGDVRPYVALGLGLKASGHEVCLAAFAGFQPLVTGQGLAFYPVPNPAATLESAPAWQAWQHSQGNSIRHLHNLRRVARLAGTAIEDMLDGFWAACQGAGAIVSSSTSLAGPHIAEKRGVAHVWALLQPMTRTRAFPYYLSPIRFPPESRFNLLTYIAAEHLFWQLFKWPINRWRQSTLGLRPLPAPGPYRSLDGAGDPILYGFSPSVVPRPADWGDGPCLAGYWFLDGPADWAPPADLVAFLAGGPPPVYVGLGRLSAPDT